MSSESKPEVTNSLERMADETMLIAMMDIDESCAAARVAKRCPKVLKILTDVLTEELEEDPSEGTLSAMIQLAIVTGWKAHEALAESEELERMAR